MPALLIVMLAFFSCVATAAGQAAAQATRRRRAATIASTKNAPPAAPERAKPSPTPTPIVVPRLSPQTSAVTQAPATEQAPAQTPATAPVQNPPAKPTIEKAPADAIDDDEEVIRVTSKLVVAPVSVTDAKGEPVQGLKAADFRLDEEGRAQEIAQVGDPEQVPLELALLLDVSGSVNARFAFELEAAARFFKEVMKPVDRATIYSIGIKPKLEQERSPSEVAAQKVMTVQPTKGPTAFYDTVIDATKYFVSSAPQQHRRVIIAITDGEDNYSERFKTALSVIPEVQRADVVFYSINPSGLALRLNRPGVRAQEGMARLAEVTGGAAFVPEALEDLGAVFRQIAAELRSQYLLQYYSNSDAPPGKYLGIKVRVPARADARIRARQGYYVPQPK